MKSYELFTTVIETKDLFNELSDIFTQVVKAKKVGNKVVLLHTSDIQKGQGYVYIDGEAVNYSFLDAFDEMKRVQSC